jgi:hypothetical protein
MKSNKLPQKSTQVLAHYNSLNKDSKRLETDTTTVTTTIISSTHIFNQ